MAGAPFNPVLPSVRACPRCGSSMPASASFCPGCGRSMKMLPPSERLAAALAYLTLVPAAVLLFVPPYRESRFVRFHACQSIVLWSIFLVLTIGALFLSNLAAALFFLLFGILVSLAMFFLWVVLSFKAWQGEHFELPLLGRLAERLR